MATLSAWKFNTPNGTHDALDRPKKPNRDYLINLRDAAAVSREAGATP